MNRKSLRKLHQKLPFVSVIVPVYNDPDGIRATIEALLKQNYPKDRYQIIIVDNNSADSTADVIKSYPVVYLAEKSIQSSYTARNRGIQFAKGDILAFTDSNCIPMQDWITNGVKGIRDKGVVLGVGRIDFFSRNRKMNIYELYDSTTWLKQHRYAKHNFGATANIFVRKEDIEKVGQFRAELISGGDYEMGLRLSRIGIVEYLDSVIVKHPSRTTFKAIMKKVSRLSRGHGQLSALGILAIPYNVGRLSFWRPQIRVWRRCEFWNRLTCKDKIRYWFIVNILRYIRKFTTIRSYNEYKKRYCCIKS